MWFDGIGGKVAASKAGRQNKREMKINGNEESEWSGSLVVLRLACFVSFRLLAHTLLTLPGLHTQTQCTCTHVCFRECRGEAPPRFLLLSSNKVLSRTVFPHPSPHTVHTHQSLPSPLPPPSPRRRRHRGPPRARRRGTPLLLLLLLLRRGRRHPRVHVRGRPRGEVPLHHVEARLRFVVCFDVGLRGGSGRAQIVRHRLKVPTNGHGLTSYTAAMSSRSSRFCASRSCSSRASK